MDQRTGQQRSYTNAQGNTLYYFWYTLANGMAGEVGHKQAGAPRFNVGDEVEATDSTNPANPQYKKLKLDKPGGAANRGGGGGSRGWSPEKEHSVMTQGFIHSAVIAGATDEDAMTKLVMAQYRVYKNLMDLWRLKHGQQQAAAPAPPPQAPAPQAQPSLPPLAPPPTPAVQANPAPAAGPQYADDLLPF